MMQQFGKQNVDKLKLEESNMEKNMKKIEKRF